MILKIAGLGAGPLKRVNACCTCVTFASAHFRIDFDAQLTFGRIADCEAILLRDRTIKVGVEIQDGDAAGRVQEIFRDS